VEELSGKSAKICVRKSVNHQRSENPPNGYKEGSVVFFCSKREELPLLSDHGATASPGPLAPSWKGERGSGSHGRTSAIPGMWESARRRRDPACCLEASLFATCLTGGTSTIQQPLCAVKTTRGSCVLTVLRLEYAFQYSGSK
jgi:hypothetical protein